MQRSPSVNAHARLLTGSALLGSLLLAPVAQADEGGMSFWLPGQFSSLAATPAAPGWNVATFYYHLSSDAGIDKESVQGGRVRAGLRARADLLFGNATYVFSNPVWGAQAALGMTAAVGRMGLGVDATLSGPQGNTVSGATEEAKRGGTDLYPMGTLKWSHGVHNTMVYTTFNVPIGAYNSNRLANIGLGHWAVDAGGGYTYFDKTNEFSIVAGTTYNFKNSDTDYQSGVDGHIDWAASRFVTPTTHVGAVGYLYHQLSGDSGAGARLGDFKSRVYALGPQVGHMFKVGNAMWYINLKGYYEFGAKNRPEGWNTWLTLAVPLGTGSGR